MRLVGLFLLGVSFLSAPGANGGSSRLLARQETNLQTLKGNLGAPAPAVTQKGALFFVEGGKNGENFKNKQAALKRSCDRQSNRCADFFNGKGGGDGGKGGKGGKGGDEGGKGGGGAGKVGECIGTQLSQCLAFIKTIK